MVDTKRVRSKASDAQIKEFQENLIQKWSEGITLPKSEIDTKLNGLKLNDKALMLPDSKIGTSVVVPKGEASSPAKPEVVPKKLDPNDIKDKDARVQWLCDEYLRSMHDKYPNPHVDLPKTYSADLLDLAYSKLLREHDIKTRKFQKTDHEWSLIPFPGVNRKTNKK